MSASLRTRPNYCAAAKLRDGPIAEPRLFKEQGPTECHDIDKCLAYRRGGAGQIAGASTVEEANELAMLLRTGEQPRRLMVIAECAPDTIG
jgi:hypothetical protein